MRYLAIDYGSKRIGLAVCDANETIVSPFDQLTVKPARLDMLIDQLRDVVIAESIDAVIFGLPLNMDGSHGPQAQLALEFFNRLVKTLTVPVHLQDERLSSAAADELLNQAGLTSAQRKKTARQARRLPDTAGLSRPNLILCLSPSARSTA